MMKFIMCLLLMLLTSCTIGYKKITSLEPTKIKDGYQYFTYKSYADAQYPVYSQEAEKVRLKWLEELLAEYGYQKKKYEIVRRRQKHKGSGPLGSSFDVFYDIKVPIE